jgi:hypothetical protein
VLDSPEVGRHEPMSRPANQPVQRCSLSPRAPRTVWAARARDKCARHQHRRTGKPRRGTPWWRIGRGACADYSPHVQGYDVLKPTHVSGPETNRASAWPRWMAAALALVSLFACGGVVYATAIVEGKVVRFKLSTSLARAHRKNRDRTMTETDAVAFVEAKHRAGGMRRAKARRSSSQ